MTVGSLAPRRAAVVGQELAKLPAFFRRDLLVLWSYRLAFFSDWVNLAMQIVVLSFIGRLVDSSTLPMFGSVRPSYVEFVAVGVAIASLLQANLARVISVVRSEQMMGTLEALFITPTAPTTIMLGSVIYDLIYVPVRTFILLGSLSVLLDLRFAIGALGPVSVLLVAFVPFLWGLSLAGAAGVLTFRRGAGVAGMGGILLVLTSGSYFPITLLPAWVQDLAALNPITIAVDATRQALLGGAGWAEVAPRALLLLPASALSLAVGFLALRWALRRERRRGTLGIY